MILIIYEAFAVANLQLCQPITKIAELSASPKSLLKVFQLNSSLSLQQRMINKFEILTLIHFHSSSSETTQRTI